ncbi:hypothetical protein, partial [Alysiella crassa]
MANVLRITHNGVQQVVQLNEETQVIQHLPNATYELVNENGEVLEDVSSKVVDGALVLDSTPQTAAPDVIVQNYSSFYQAPVLNNADHVSYSIASKASTVSTGVSGWGNWGSVLLSLGATAGLAYAINESRDDNNHSSFNTSSNTATNSTPPVTPPSNTNTTPVVQPAPTTPVT